MYLCDDVCVLCVFVEDEEIMKMKRNTVGRCMKSKERKRWKKMKKKNFNGIRTCMISAESGNTTFIPSVHELLEKQKWMNNVQCCCVVGS